MKKRLVNIVEILLSLGWIPLWFAKIVYRVDCLPGDEPNVIMRVESHHSLFEEITTGAFGFMFPVSMALIALSVFVSAVCLKYPDRKALRVAGHILCGMTFCAFPLSGFLALQ